VFLVHPKLGRDEDSASLGSGVPTSRLRLEAMEPGMAVPHVGTLFGVPRIVRAVVLSKRSKWIGLLNLDAKCAGARSAGNPHATCDVAGAGNGATAIPNRARRGKPRIHAKEVPTGHRASARPYQSLSEQYCGLAGYTNLQNLTDTTLDSPPHHLRSGETLSRQLGHLTGMALAVQFKKRDPRGMLVNCSDPRTLRKIPRPDTTRQPIINILRNVKEREDRFVVSRIVKEPLFFLPFPGRLAAEPPLPSSGLSRLPFP